MEKLKKKFFKALELIKLNRASVAQVYNERGELKYSALLFFGSFVVNLVLSTLLFPSGFRALFSKYSLWPLMIPYLAVIVMAGALCFILERAFKKKSNFEGVLNLLFHVGVFWWLTVIPQLFAVIGFLDISALTSLVWHLGFALMLWSLYVVLRDVLHVKENNIVFALILAVFSYFLAQTLLGSLLIGSSYHLF